MSTISSGCSCPSARPHCVCWFVASPHPSKLTTTCWRDDERRRTIFHVVGDHICYCSRLTSPVVKIAPTHRTFALACRQSVMVAVATGGGGESLPMLFMIPHDVSLLNSDCASMSLCALVKVLLFLCIDRPRQRSVATLYLV